MPSSACDWSSDVCSSDRSEEHTSELQSRSDLVCRLLLEKKKHRYVVTSEAGLMRGRLVRHVGVGGRLPIRKGQAPPTRFSGVRFVPYERLAARVTVRVRR